MFGPHDGVRAQVPPYRRMMPFLMRGRNESAVYFEQTLDQLTAALGDDVREARSDRPSHVDKELAVLLRLPGFLLAFAIGLLDRLYRWGLAPRSLVDTDPMYASAFVANLGSLKIDAAYHHLYEHGNCPLFVTIGQISDGHVLLRYTFDERVEDGHYCAGALKLLAERIAHPAPWVAASVRPEPDSGL